MKLINPKAEVLIQPPGLDGIYKQIEIAGRTCYKSEDKITEASAVDFVKRMVTSNHTAMLEHGTVYLRIPNLGVKDAPGDCLRSWYRYKHNPYSKCLEIPYNDPYELLVTTNLRVLQENGWLDDLQYICKSTKSHEKRITLRFSADIHFYKDATRHRTLSYAIESTRFCNYMKEKFGMSVSFMPPTWLTDENREEFEEDCKTIESIYFKWLNKGLRPEQAAYWLIQGTAATVVITGFASDWRHFFDLRYFGKTGKPHPDMEYLATLAKEALEKEGLWEEIIAQPSKVN